MNQNFRNFALWAIIALLLIALFQLFSNGSQNANTREVPIPSSCRTSIRAACAR